MYLYLSSTDSKHIHSENTWYDFIVDLPERITCNEQNPLYVAIVDAYFPQNIIKDRVFYMFSNIIHHSILKGAKLQVLGIAHNRDPWTNPCYHRVLPGDISSIRLSIKDIELLTPSLDSTEPVLVTLHFTRCP